MVATEKKRITAKDIFTSKNITRMAVFTVLSYILYLPYFEFSIIPTVQFLKIDFSNTFVMMAGFAMGPIAAMIVGALKEVLHALTFSQTVGVGELANILIMLPYVLIPSIIYRRHRNIKTVFWTLALGSVAQAVWSIPVNYLLSFPFFAMAFIPNASWSVGMELYLSVWYWAVLFNFVKTLLVSAAVLLLYKQFQRLFALIFNDKKAAPVSSGEGAATTGEEQKITVSSAEEMEKLGERMAEEVKGGDVLLLSGELGAGKTVFTKGLARGLGIEAPVLSPTFTLMNEYPGGRIKLCHFDAYRLSGVDEGTEAGLSDFFGNDECVCAVEWWENIETMFDGLKTITISIEKTGDTTREVTIKR